MSNYSVIINVHLCKVFNQYRKEVPFLDKDTIQEFLRISVQLKNSCYKNCIAKFLDIYNYPFEKEKKIGFIPQKTKFSIKERIAYRIRNMLGLKQTNG